MLRAGHELKRFAPDYRREAGVTIFSSLCRAPEGQRQVVTPREEVLEDYQGPKKQAARLGRMRVIDWMVIYGALKASSIGACLETPCLSVGFYCVFTPSQAILEE